MNQNKSLLQTCRQGCLRSGYVVFERGEAAFPFFRGLRVEAFAVGALSAELPLPVALAASDEIGAAAAAAMLFSTGFGTIVLDSCSACAATAIVRVGSGLSNASQR